MKWPMNAVVGIAIFGFALAAEPPFDAAAAAKRLAPFLDDQTIAVARVDLVAVSVDDWANLVAKWAALPAQQLAESQKLIRDLHEQLRKAGAKEAYFVISLANLPQPGPFFVVPMVDGTNSAAVTRAFRTLGSVPALELHGCLAIGPKGALDRLKTMKPAARPELAAALGAFPDAVAQVAVVSGADQRRVIEELLPDLPADLGGGHSTALTRGIQWIAAGIEAKPAATLRVVVQAADAGAARELEKIAAKAVDFVVRAGVEMELDLKPLAPLLTPKVSGDRLTLSLRDDDPALGKVLSAVTSKARAASGRVSSMNNLKQLALAMHIYADSYGNVFPPHAIYSEDGKTPLLSWRVMLLPYLEQDELYKKFKLNEPWDSPNNKALIPLMPKVYLDPLAPPGGQPGTTHYQLFVGPKAAWQRGPKGPALPRAFLDGTSNTILIAEAAEPVIWTKPDDIAFDPDQPLPKLGVDPKLGFLAAMADGAVRVIGPKVSEKTRKAAVTPAGGETLGPDW